METRRIDKGDLATSLGIAKLNLLNISSLRIEFVADLDASIACEKLDELKRAFLEVVLNKVCEMLVSPKIFLFQ